VTNLNQDLTPGGGGVGGRRAAEWAPYPLPQDYGTTGLWDHRTKQKAENRKLEAAGWKSRWLGTEIDQVP